MFDDKAYQKKKIFCWSPRYADDSPVGIVWMCEATVVTAYINAFSRRRTEIKVYKYNETLMMDILAGRYINNETFYNWDESKGKCSTE